MLPTSHSTANDFFPGTFQTSIAHFPGTFQTSIAQLFQFLRCTSSETYVGHLLYKLWADINVETLSDQGIGRRVDHRNVRLVLDSETQNMCHKSARSKSASTIKYS